MIRFAANLSMMFAEVPLPQRFAAAKAAGFPAVEVQFPYEMPADEIVRTLRETGLEMILINTPPGDFAAGERGLGCLPEREADFAALFSRAIAYATRTGARFIHMMAGIPPAGTDPAEADRIFIGNLKAALAASEGSGITLLVEPLNPIDFPGYHLVTFAHARRLIEAVGDPRLRLQLDLYNREMSEGDAEGGLRRYIDIAPHIQIAGVPGRHEPDVGRMDYRRLFEVIKELGYTGWIGCEYRPVGDTVAGLGWRDRLLPRP